MIDVKNSHPQNWPTWNKRCAMWKEVGSQHLVSHLMYLMSHQYVNIANIYVNKPSVALMYLMVDREKLFLNLVDSYQISLVITLQIPFIIKRHYVCCEIYRKSVIKIQIWYGLTRFRKDLFVCRTIDSTHKLRFYLNTI